MTKYKAQKYTFKTYVYIYVSRVPELTSTCVSGRSGVLPAGTAGVTPKYNSMLVPLW